MGWFARPQVTQSAGAQARDAEWAEALAKRGLPVSVAERLEGARAGRLPWVATMTPAELLTARSHGLRPVATVSGTCWYGFGRSWTEGHAAGWKMALDRIRREAVAAGANAVVDVQMRTIRHRIGPSMDFTLLGTAVHIEGLPAGKDPVIATVPALEFVRLLEMGIVPCGIAIGARFKWMDDTFAAGITTRRRRTALGAQRQMQRWAGNTAMIGLTDFWEEVRRSAHADLRRSAGVQGNGVLAHIHFGQLIRQERGDKVPPNFLGRHIVVGTVIDTPRGAPVPHGIEPVVDMRDAASPLAAKAAVRHTAYPVDGEGEGAI